MKRHNQINSCKIHRMFCFICTLSDNNSFFVMIVAEQFFDRNGWTYILLGILLFFTRPSPLHSYIPRVNSITQKHQDFMDTFHALGMNHITNGYCLITDVTAIENSFSANRDLTASDRD